MKTVMIKTKMLMALVILSSMANMVCSQEDSAYYSVRDNSLCRSIFTGYNTIDEESSIVRSNSQNQVVHTQCKNPLTGLVKHTFLIKNLSGNERAVITYFNAADSTCWSVDVTDMRLFDDLCYFCGTIKHTYVNYLGEYVTHGIIGRFEPHQILNGTGTIQCLEVEETAHLTHLAISRASESQLLVSAIGDKSWTGTACMVEAVYCGGQEWNLKLDTLETPQGVIFSDIMTVRDSIRLLMQYKCNDDSPFGSNNYDYRHQLFMMDCFGQNGCYASYNPSMLYYLAHYDLALDGNYFFHYNNAPMRLGHINDLDKQFCVAFGVEETDGVHGGLRFFPFKHQWKYDSCIYYRMGSQTEIKEVGNLYRTATVMLLSKDNQHSNGVATLPMLGTATHNVTQLYTSAYAMNSFTQEFVGDYIGISGHNNYKLLQLMDQDITQLVLPSCFDKQAFQYTSLGGQQAAKLVAKWKFTDVITHHSKVISYSETDLAKSIVCKKCIK